ncbi:zinc transporter ZIP1-like [Melozone crissalis]|uniref:zinc transporter ZIP1-like n=1 Tax=Melozone crissalis TaxID=40204 RepID=UPI0023DAC524|nr:zinc transporter ZIP1-like [Melozone crissalis]
MDGLCVGIWIMNQGLEKPWWFNHSKVWPQADLYTKILVAYSSAQVCMQSVGQYYLSIVLLILMDSRALLPNGSSIQAAAPGPGVPVGSAVPAAPGALRAGALALALHAVLEGLALGLREGDAAALRVLRVLLLHKGAVAFGLSLELLRSRLRPPAVASCLVLLALMSPLGVGVGTALAAGAGPRQRLCRAVLEGLAAGTFPFVTFLEILPQELGVPRNRIPKVTLILAGFALVSAILFVKG